MSKITKKQLHNGWHGHDTEIIKMKKELRELKQSVLRLEKLTDEKLLDEPQLKQLDQSVFDGLDEKWRFAARCLSGKAIATESEPRIVLNGYYCDGGYLLIGEGYDTSNWRNSLIERERKELTGSDLTEQIMKNQKYQAAFVSDESEQDALNSQRTALIDNVYMSDRDYRFRAELNGYRYAVPINNQGEPLTASEVGL